MSLDCDKSHSWCLWLFWPRDEANEAGQWSNWSPVCLKSAVQICETENLKKDGKTVNVWINLMDANTLLVNALTPYMWDFLETHILLYAWLYFFVFTLRLQQNPEYESLMKQPIKPQTLLECLWTSDTSSYLWETACLCHSSNRFPLLNMCIWAYFEWEKKCKNFMKLVHWVFMQCSFSANGRTPTGPLSSHITHKNTPICTGSCHTVSGVCQRFASAQTSQANRFI